MVSTRSSARKPPNPHHPLQARPIVAPVADDPPPPYPRRSPRIKIKNGQTIPICTPSRSESGAQIRCLQSCEPPQGLNQESQNSPAQTLKAVQHATDNSHPDRGIGNGTLYVNKETVRIPQGDSHSTHAIPSQRHGYQHKRPVKLSERSDPNEKFIQEVGRPLTPNRSAARENRLLGTTSKGYRAPETDLSVSSGKDKRATTDSRIDTLEEVTPTKANQTVEELNSIQPVNVAHSMRRTSRRRSRRRKKRITNHSTLALVQPDGHGDQHTSSEFVVPERLAPSAIATVRSVLRDVKARKHEAKAISSQKKQVQRMRNLKKSCSVGNIEIASLANAFPAITGGISKPRRLPATSFFASCERHGVKRVPGARIARIAASAASPTRNLKACLNW